MYLNTEILKFLQNFETMIAIALKIVYVHYIDRLYNYVSMHVTTHYVSWITFDCYINYDYSYVIM